MDALTPRSPEELAGALFSAASARELIHLGGNFTKQSMAGPLPPGGVTISTRCMRRILQYEPNDLTISVEAGLPFPELAAALAEHGQMVPLDPPFESATVGGAVAANTSGPRRRLYGTARDMIIGMKFATLEGKLVQSGGMVVKNVAGLDMAKLMIGSFGTLAPIAVVNFKVVPMPRATRTFLLSFDEAAGAIGARDSVLRSVLQPAALEVLNPQAAARLRLDGWMLVVEAGGSEAVIDRYARELAGAQPVEGEPERALWRGVQHFTPEFLKAEPAGAVVRVSTTLDGIGAVMQALPGPSLARGGTGVVFGYFPSAAAAAQWVKDACARQWKAVVEFAPPQDKAGLDLWPCPGGDLELMRRVKAMFDPENLLNPGRLYGRI